MTARRGWSLRIFGSAFVLFSLLGGLWALATPIFASPDETAHAVKAIAEVRGDVLGSRTDTSRFPVYHLPDGYRYPVTATCFAYDPDRSGSCSPAFGDAAGSSTFDDWVSGYNPVYYAIVGLPSLVWSGPSAIYAMRLLSVMMVSAIVAATFTVALGADRARWMPAGLAFLAGPMNMFLSGSVNPQALEFSAGPLFVVTLVRLVEKAHDPERVRLRSVTLWTLLVLGGSLLAIARATGPLWVVVLIALGFTAAGWRRALVLFRMPRNYVPIGVLAALGMFSIGWTLYSGSLSGQAQSGDAPLVRGGFLEGAWAMLRATPFFLQSAAGEFGWQDTTPPGLSYAAFFGALVLIGVLAFVGAGRRDRWTLVVALLAALLVPVLVQAASVSRTGIIWQGRYGLFLYLSAILLAAWVLSRSPRVAWMSSPVTLVVAVLLWAFGSVCFLSALRRYVVGASHPLTAMLDAPLWQPPGGWPLLATGAVLVGLVFAVWVMLLERSMARAEGAAAVDG